MLWWHSGEVSIFAVVAPDLSVVRFLIFKGDQVIDIVESEVEVVAEGTDGSPNFFLRFITKRECLIIGTGVV